MNNILCFGDSNTWGYNPATKERYPYNIRWTGLLSEKLNEKNIRVIENGLCGRTTVYEDETRPGRKGLDAIQKVFEENNSVDAVVIMLGTNDCKTFNNSSSSSIAEGIEECLNVILQHVCPQNVLLLSPIHLGENVWKAEYDTEFDQNSVLISKELKEAYGMIANKRGVHFLSASDYATPSLVDQEHLDELGHKQLAEAIYREVLQMDYCA